MVASTHAAPDLQASPQCLPGAVEDHVKCSRRNVHRTRDFHFRFAVDVYAPKNIAIPRSQRGQKSDKTLASGAIEIRWIIGLQAFGKEMLHAFTRSPFRCILPKMICDRVTQDTIEPSDGPFVLPQCAFPIQHLEERLLQDVLRVSRVADLLGEKPAEPLVFGNDRIHHRIRL